MPDRPIRGCDFCNKSDDHPRCVHHIRAVNGVPQPPQVRHMDCCAESGCETAQATEAENEGRRGQELIDHLAARRAEVSSNG